MVHRLSLISLWTYLSKFHVKSATGSNIDMLSFSRFGLLCYTESLKNFVHVVGVINPFQFCCWTANQKVHLACQVVQLQISMFIFFSLILKISPDDPDASFRNIARELFSDGIINWGRIVALFYFAFKLIIKVCLFSQCLRFTGIVCHNWFLGIFK